MKIGFIGCGNMAKAMIGGVIRSGVCQKEEILASDAFAPARSAAAARAKSRRTRRKRVFIPPPPPSG